MNLSKMRTWLERNKIFFETIAAVLLSVMSILISCFGHKLAMKQTQLAEIQTRIAEKQFESQLRREKVEKTAYWGDLRNAIWKIFDLYPPSGTETIRSFPQEQQLSFFKKIREILDSQIGNPVLIEDQQCLGYWRNAISAGKTYSAILGSVNKVDALQLQDAVVANANSILEDMGRVWIELILNSDEVSPTGGRPKINSKDADE
jgi:hypothetical protein